MKGFLIFCGLMLTIGLVWVTVPRLDGRDKNYEERLIGALKFLDGTIETSQDLGADLYAPSIERRSEPGHWVLSGIMVTRDSMGRTGRAPFSAIIESTCADYADPICWRLKKLAVDGQAVGLSALASSNQTSTLAGGYNGNAIEISAPKEPSTLTFSEAAATQSMTASPPLENGTMPPTTGVNGTPSSEILVAGVDVEARVLRVDGEGDVAFENKLVWLTQRALRKLRYDPGPLDGKLGPRTASEIESYQRVSGLTADGRPSRNLLRHMREEIRDMDAIMSPFRSM
jgi:hypothetical protein